MQSEKDALIELYAGDAFKNRNNPDLTIGVWRQHFVEFADKLAAMSAAEPVAWRWRSTLFAEWNLSDKPPLDQQSMEQLTALNMEGLEWQALYADTVRPDFFEVEEIREKKLATVASPDNGTTAEVLAAVLECAEAWVPEARIIGNVRAGDIARVVRSALSAQVQDVAGWQLVPKERTPEMIEAATFDSPYGVSNKAWADMLAAAPAKQEGGHD